MTFLFPAGLIALASHSPDHTHLPTLGKRFEVKLFLILYFYYYYLLLLLSLNVKLFIFPVILFLIFFFKKVLLLSDSENLRLWTEHVSALNKMTSSESPLEKLWRGGFLHLIVAQFLAQCQRRIRPPFYDANSLVR